MFRIQCTGYQKINSVFPIILFIIIYRVSLKSNWQRPRKTIWDWLDSIYLCIFKDAPLKSYSPSQLGLPNQFFYTTSKTFLTIVYQLRDTLVVGKTIKWGKFGKKVYTCSFNFFLTFLCARHWLFWTLHYKTRQGRAFLKVLICDGFLRKFKNSERCSCENGDLDSHSILDTSPIIIPLLWMVQ